MRIRKKKDRGGTKEVAGGKRRLGKSGSGIRLLDSRNKTLAELRKGYRNVGAVEVMCNTQKLTKTTSRDLFRVARTAGQFGIFCACWIVLAMDIFYLGESLSQSWGFLIKLMYDFPQKLEPISQYFLGYDNACQFKDFLC